MLKNTYNINLQEKCKRGKNTNRKGKFNFFDKF